MSECNKRIVDPVRKTYNKIRMKITLFRFIVSLFSNNRGLRQGLSLIEVSIAILVLSIIVGGSLSMFSQGHGLARKSQEKAAAHCLVREVMEEYSDWARLVARTGANPPANGTYVNPPLVVARNNVNYTPSLIISSGPLPAPELKQLEVNVTWAGGTFQVRTLKGNY
ncbi:MAG: prepilin-type N-terminal cleavage/methylation domain-containing protein [Candidatus Omnitrophica bacterium]|nr:prepilin-type N-terminal cleavage/methylation domain-containing protein [Candidatus Omnitrophota bacterium]